MRMQRRLVVLLLVTLAALAGWWQDRRQSDSPANPRATGDVAATGRFQETARIRESGLAAIERAYEERLRGVWVEAEGTALRQLPDDERGDRHQRWIVELSPDLTVLMAHNIDLAPRVLLEPGQRLQFRGRYEWNERGGVIHWTHRDPSGRKAGGWIEVEGRRFW